MTDPNLTPDEQAAERLLAAESILYRVWRRQMPDSAAPSRWMATAYFVKGRSSDDAQSRMQRLFAGCRFHHMALVAIQNGYDPNETTERSRVVDPS